MLKKAFNNKPTLSQIPELIKITEQLRATLIIAQILLTSAKHKFVKNELVPYTKRHLIAVDGNTCFRCV